MSAAKVELGRYLFYDKRMSVNGKEIVRDLSPAGTSLHRRTFSRRGHDGTA
jgi:hypothetical protein